VIRSFLLLLFLLLTGSALAAEPAALPDGATLRGRFVQERVLKGFAAPLRSEGSFLLSPGRGLVWRAEKPFAVTTVMSPAGLVQEVKGNETMRLPTSRLPFLSRLYAMLGGALTGDWRALEGAFTVAREDAGKGWRLVLTPRSTDDPAMPIRAITVRGDRFVEEVEIAKPDGDHDRLLFLDQTLGTAPPGAEEARLLDGVAR